MKLDEIENAFYFVASAPYGEHVAVLNRESGEIYYRSEMTGLDEIPKDARGVESWIEIPHLNDLGMGRDLVFEFVAERLPSDYGQVQAFFRSRGAYSRYKALLLERGVLEEWYDFENSRKQAAIRQWCLDNGIDISD